MSNDNGAVDLVQLTRANQYEVERDFVATVFLYPVYAVVECGWLDPETLVNHETKKFWTLVKERITPDTPDAEATSLVQGAALEAGMDIWMYSRRAAATPTHTYPQALAQEIARRSYVTGVARQAKDLAASIVEGDAEQIQRVLSEMRSVMPAGGQDDLPTAEDAHERFEKLVLAGDLAVPTDIEPLDDVIGGLEKSALTILAARPSTGKTALAFQIADIALAGKKVHFYSLEMSLAGLWARRACPLAGVTWPDVTAKRLSQEKIKEMLEKGRVLSRAYGKNLMVDDRPQTTETIWRKVAADRPDLVIVDHVRLLKDAWPGVNENKRQGRITENLHEMSKAHNVAVLALAQLNRNLENRAKEDQAPTLSDLRDSGEIEENADNVMMIHRPAFNDGIFQAAEELSRTEVHIRKWRNGQANTLIELGFRPNTEKFEKVKSTGMRSYAEARRATVREF